MSNIILFFNSPVVFQGEYQVLCFYEGLSKALEEAGNNVLQVVTSDFISTPWNGQDNTPISSCREERALLEIRKFNPDLIISFNNSKILKIEKQVNCPIVIWDADDYLFFNDKKGLRKNIDRYLFFAFFEYSKKNLESYLPIPKNNIAVIPPATFVKASKEEKKYPISFIATPFMNSHKLIKFLVDCPFALEDDFRVSSKNYERMAMLLQEYGLQESELKFARASGDRMNIVMLLLGFGLNIFGPRNWLDLAKYTIDIIRLYHTEAVFSLKHNETIYNRSKISLSVNHSQNTDAYPWRVPDILASDSVLLAQDTLGLMKDLKSIKGLQSFNSSIEAYEKANKLLRDPVLRDEIVLQQNQLVEENFRWIHRFPVMEELTGVSIKSDNPGSITRLGYQRNGFDMFLSKVMSVIVKNRDKSHFVSPCNLKLRILRRLRHEYIMLNNNTIGDKEYK